MSALVWLQMGQKTTENGVQQQYNVTVVFRKSSSKYYSSNVSSPTGMFKST